MSSMSSWFNKIISEFNANVSEFTSKFTDIRLMDLFDWLPADIASVISTVISLLVIVWLFHFLCLILLRD